MVLKILISFDLLSMVSLSEFLNAVMREKGHILLSTFLHLILCDI